MVKQLFYQPRKDFRERSSFNRQSKLKGNTKEISKKWDTSLISYISKRNDRQNSSLKTYETHHFRLYPHHLSGTPLNHKIPMETKLSKYANPKFTAPPSPSCVPLPPLHWRQHSSQSKEKCTEMLLHLKN